MKKIVTLILLLNILSFTYSQEYDNKYYPYLKTRTKDVKPPASFIDALNQLDLVLKNEILDYFKREKEEVATIKISQELSSFFIINWHLQTYAHSYFGNQIINPYSELAKEFSELGLDNPVLTMRVVFTSLHRKLNNKEFLLQDEIDKIKKKYSPSVWKIKSIEEYLDSKKRIKSYEDSILFADKLLKFHINDTIGRWYYETKRESKNYITCVIKNIDSSNKEISAQIFDIVSNRRYRSVYYSDKLKSVQDTIKVNFNNWNKLNESLFDYRYGKYKASSPRWNNYIYTKYNEN